MEFAHYEDPQSRPSPDFESGSCGVTYTTEASWKEVLGYYDERLRQHGWEVVEVQAHYYPKGMEDSGRRPPKIATGKRLSDLSGLPQDLEQVSLSASRDGYSYTAGYESPSKDDPDIPDDKALVGASVSKGFEDTPPACGSEEREALAEFSHYGGRNDLGMAGDEKGACTTGYSTRASQEWVIAYYEEKLTEHGWKVEQSPTAREGRIEASRDGLRYVVHYRGFPEGDTNVRVEVYKG